MRTITTAIEVEPTDTVTLSTLNNGGVRLHMAGGVTLEAADAATMRRFVEVLATAVGLTELAPAPPEHWWERSTWHDIVAGDVVSCDGEPHPVAGIKASCRAGYRGDLFVTLVQPDGVTRDIYADPYESIKVRFPRTVVATEQAA